MLTDQTTLGDIRLDESGFGFRERIRDARVTLINKTKHLNEADFIIRLLYKHSY